MNKWRIWIYNEMFPINCAMIIMTLITCF